MIFFKSLSSTKKKIFIVLILVIFGLNQMYSQNAWEYTGIPYTDWDYDPFKIELETPTEWPSTPKQNYYYVDPDNPNATDVIEQGELTGVYGRFGYPDKP